MRAGLLIVEGRADAALNLRRTFGVTVPVEVVHSMGAAAGAAPGPGGSGLASALDLDLPDRDGLDLLRDRQMHGVLPALVDSVKLNRDVGQTVQTMRAETSGSRHLLNNLNLIDPEGAAQACVDDAAIGKRIEHWHAELKLTRRETSS